MPAPANIVDFSGGYDTDTSELTMKLNRAIRAENAIWRSQLIQRGGHRPYGTATYAASDVVRGVSSRAYINGAWGNIEAIDLDASSDVRFFLRTTTGIALLSASEVFTTGIKVVFAELNGKFVAVNGTDKPKVIYYSGGWVVENLETHDTRQWSNTTWNAGQWDNSETGTEWIDDTTDAQDDGADDFQLGSATNNDGFYISSANPFNKVVLSSAQQAGGAPVAQYRYWSTTGWKALTLTTTPTWTAAAGDRTMEWDYITDIDRYSGEEEATVSNFFVIRVRFTTAASGAFSCDSAAVYHTQYLTELLSGSIPHWVAEHNSRLWLADGYITYWSPPNDVINWRGLSESEYFMEGGPEIRGMLSHVNYLIIFKDTKIYHFYGNSIDSYLRDPVADYGLAEPGAYTVGGNDVYFLSADGFRVLKGRNCYRISRHIETDFKTFSTTGCVAAQFNGECYFSFPADSQGLWFEPSGLEIDEETGEGMVGFFKFTNWNVDNFVVCDGQGDTGHLWGIYNDTTPYVARLMNGSTDQNRAAVDAAIDFRHQIGHIPFGRPLQKKIFGSLRMLLKRDSSAAADYTLTYYADGTARNDSVTFSVPAGTTSYVRKTRLPPAADGYTLSLEIRQNGQQDAGLQGFAIEYEYGEFI